ncbi:MAG: cytochrome c biogenesis protein ResB [Alphaproteobacteria bacterium]|nr:cytochrome c biogenesis protein ResB [Alphaproteobacteria bacterium]MDD9920155.1 cytochrome c biogenesis protein ResB [Alphaproteobacteria bacterium]
MQFLQLSARTEVFFCSLLWLMILLVAGTIAQKDIGLYAAQQRYFSSAILWVGNVFPLPGGFTVLAIVAWNLAVKLTLQKWIWKQVGTLITHVGALVLLVGGFITSQFSIEGNMVIAEGESSNFISDYYALELALTDVESGHDVKIFEEPLLQEGGVLVSEAPKIKMVIAKYCRNCDLIRLEEPRLEPDVYGLPLNFDISAKTLEKEFEQNLAALLFNVEDTEDENGFYGVMQGMPIPQFFELSGKKYLLTLRHKRTYMPFEVRLIDFEKQTYMATTMAKSYKSEVVLRDKGVEWPAVIEMNQPLRYQGYTLFQSSFVQDETGESTVLAVVQNSGRLFPYISSIIICLGLLIHLIQRLPHLVRKR